MSKRSIIILIALVVVGLILASVIPPHLGSPSRIASKAAGAWQEVGQTPAYDMQVRHTSGREYSVTYPRWQYVDEPFQLQGEQLVHDGGENTMNDAVTKISYTNGSDELTIGDKGGEHVHTLARISQ